MPTSLPTAVPSKVKVEPLNIREVTIVLSP
jgi:hypothetical protein